MAKSKRINRRVELLAQAINQNRIELLDHITDAFERSIATANLIATAHYDFGEEIDDSTIATAAMYLRRDLKKLQKEVELLSAQ